MITGDNPLTACHVAKQLKMVKKDPILVLNAETLSWESIDGNVQHPFQTTDDKALVEKYDLCVTGIFHITYFF